MNKKYFWILIIVALIALFSVVAFTMISQKNIFAASGKKFTKTGGSFKDEDSGLYIYFGNYKNDEGKVIESNTIVTDKQNLNEEQLNEKIQQWGCNGNQ